MAEEIKIALVTGASRGLGFAVARALGAAGWQVVALARTQGGLEELDEAIRAAGGRPATLVPADLADDPALERLGAAIHERWGRLDLWVHTAVHAPPLAPVEHVDARDLDRSLAITLRATQRLIRVLDPLLRRAAAGRAVFFDDPAAGTDALHGAYGAAKAGAAALAAAWGRGLEQSSAVRVLAATPPPMATAVRARFHPGEDTARLAGPAAVAGRLLDALAAGRTGAVDLG